MDAKTKKSVDKIKGMSIENRIGEKKKKKPMKVFEKKPANSHLMKGGVVMSGAKHNKDSKVIGKMAKGSKEMKEKMAKLRAMRKKK
jgi:hypothetical protein